MDVRWLKGLAVRLCEVLVERGIVVSHCQALDTVAAVAGLRDWPEVMAFSPQVEQCRFDRLSVKRLARRVASRHGVSIPIEHWLAVLDLSAGRQTARYAATERLILTGGDSGAGHLKMSMIADRVVSLAQGEDFVFGPVPLGDTPADFFRNRDAAYDANATQRLQQWSWLRTGDALQAWADVVADCVRYRRYDLWVDPEPAHQLLFIRTLTWLAQQTELRDKLYVSHVDTLLGERKADDLATMAAISHPVTDGDLRIARSVWDAYRQPTPLRCAALLGQDLDRPALSRTMRLMLSELPDPEAGLGASQRRLLERISGGDARPTELFTWNAQHDPDRVCDYWQFGALLDELASGETPAITGLAPGPFDATLHDTGPEKRRRYMASRLSLTTFGRELIAGRSDFARHNRIDRWWGGTHLTNANLWRWDRRHERLVAPG